MQPLLFIVFPYAALLLAIGFGLYRRFARRYTYSSLSSQLLENRKLFWGSVPWHYGVTLILLAHLLVWLFPGISRRILSDPVRLLALEVAGFALGWYAVVGIVVLIIRRLPMSSKARAVTSPMDWILLVILAAQVLSGAGVALFNRWGSLWYLSTAVPWLWSLLRLSPDSSTVVALPALIRFHFVCGFVVILLFPFTRLVHIFTIPIEYLWRPYQVVVWYRDRRRELTRVAPRLQAIGPEPSDSTRRRFLTRVGIALGASAAAVVGLPSIGFLLGLRKVPEEWRNVGAVESFQVGRTVEVAFLDPSPLPWAGVTARTAAWLRRHSETEFIAFSINCTHLGCPVRWLQDADLFMCPCHGGVFDADGTAASGPPPRPLSRYPVRMRDGMVEIRTSPLPIAVS